MRTLWLRVKVNTAEDAPTRNAASATASIANYKLEEGEIQWGEGVTFD